MNNTPRQEVLEIFSAAVARVQPYQLVTEFLKHDFSFQQELSKAKRVLVVGGGKAGAGMAQATADFFADKRIECIGIVNIPGTSATRSGNIILHPGRPEGSNFPTAAGVAGAEQMIQLFQDAQPGDLGICLLSGGGSALLPAPHGATLEQKLQLTKALQQSGCTIQEMNAVRKHFSRIKGGRLAQAFRGDIFFSLVISDVVGDPLDVIASGPTAADSTTFTDAIAVIKRYRLWESLPPDMQEHLRAGEQGKVPETLKADPPDGFHKILGSNHVALGAAAMKAEVMGYRVLNLGSYFEGEAEHVARTVAAVVKSVLKHAVPVAPPCCILFGGETTVSLPANHGKGGRNQELCLHLLSHFNNDDWQRLTILCAGTDGEDGPTDAAGAVADLTVFQTAHQLHLEINQFQTGHDAYHFWEQTEGLVKTGLTGTNVMDIGVVLIQA